MSDFKTLIISDIDTNPVSIFGPSINGMTRGAKILSTHGAVLPPVGFSLAYNAILIITDTRLPNDGGCTSLSLIDTVDQGGEAAKYLPSIMWLKSTKAIVSSDPYKHGRRIFESVIAEIERNAEAKADVTRQNMEAEREKRLQARRQEREAMLLADPSIDESELPEITEDEVVVEPLFGPDVVWFLLDRNSGQPYVYGLRSRDGTQFVSETEWKTARYPVADQAFPKVDERRYPEYLRKLLKRVAPHTQDFEKPDAICVAFAPITYEEAALYTAWYPHTVFINVGITVEGNEKIALNPWLWPILSFNGQAPIIVKGTPTECSQVEHFMAVARGANPIQKRC